ncbi:MAG TPA: patatin [Microscillaceae bacterium]|nr:patatin [Microscillaceae bacterium]
MSKKVRILSLDGGGIRGVIPATVLKYVEEELQKKSGKPNARLADYIDLVAGTSTGGILGCFYLVPNDASEPNAPSAKYTTQEALDFYAKEGYNIFNKSKRSTWLGLRQLFNATQYKPNALEQIFKKEFGELKLSELMRKCLVTTYNMKATAPFFFDSREAPSKNREFYVRDVTRSTSAAPTYFPPADITNLATGEQMVNIDGGVFANDPTMVAYTECRKTNFPQINQPTAKDMLILSIGTGGGQFQMKKLGNSGQWWVGKWATYIPNIMMDGALDTVTTQMRWIYESLEQEDKSNYLRVDVPEDYVKDYSSDMADASPDNITKLQKAGQAAVDEARKNGLDTLIQKLIDNSPDEPVV